MPMEMFMKVNGKKIKHMAKVFIIIQMEPNTKVSGLKINSMDMV